MTEFQVKERSLRDESYEENLSYERHITEVFIRWCKINGFRYRINPTDSSFNLLGSDVTIKKGNIKYEVDLKGCRHKYNTVALSYERRYDGITWRQIFNDKKITDLYVFIDELDNIYGITKDEILFRFDFFKKTTVDKQTAGHFQKCILIPKEELKLLN